VRLSWKDVLILTAFPCFIATGQILFKLTAAQVKGKPPGAALMAAVSHPVFYGALAVYVLGTLMWLWILGRYSLTIAYPFAAVALVAVPLLEVLFFGVHTSPPYWMGLLLIVSGVLLVTRSRVAPGAPPAGNP